MQPIIRLLLSLFAFVTVIAVTAPVPANAAETKFKPTQSEIQDVAIETALLAYPEKLTALGELTKPQLDPWLEHSSRAMLLYQWKHQVNFEPEHRINILLALADMETGGRHWFLRPRCQSPEFQALALRLYPEASGYLLTLNGLKKGICLAGE